jgi:hypothetical protein
VRAEVNRSELADPVVHQFRLTIKKPLLSKAHFVARLREVSLQKVNF